MSSPPKKYVCGYCSRAFTRSEHKQRHERSHTNEKPFHCSYCTSAFVRRDLLQRHCRTVHHIRLASRAHTKDPSVSKGGSVVNLENTWKPKPSTNSRTSIQTAPIGDCISPTSNGLSQVSPKTEPDMQPQKVTLKPYSTSSPPKVSPLSPRAKSGSLDEQTSPSAISDGYTPRISHAFPGPAHTAANPPLGPRCTTSPALDTESNIVASAKALLQLAPQNSSSDVLQGSPDGGAGGAGNAGGTGLGTPFDPASAPSSASSSASSSLDVLQILSLAKIFEQYYFPEDLKYPLNEFFYIGYSIIAREHYNTLPTSHSEIQSYNSIFSQGQPHTFKVGLAYSILAVGCLSMAGKSSQKENEKLAAEFMGKARDSLIEKSVSSQNTPANQLKLLSSLYLLTNVCIGHFDTDSTMDVLEDTTHATIQSLPPHLIETEMELLWKIYILVSESKPYGKPPKFYTWFLGQKLNGTVLADLMRTYSSPGPTDLPIAGKMAQVVISTISNELNSLTTEKALWIYSSRLELHSALGCINKSVSYGPNSEIFEIFRRKLIIEASAQCKDLLEVSVFEITSSSQLNLLFATLRELDVTLDFHQFMQQNLNSSFQLFVEEARGFFQTEDNYSLRLSGNFGLVSFPIIFNETFLGLQSAPCRVSQLSLNTLEKTNLEVFVLQWYAIFAKTLVNVVVNNNAVSISQAFSKNAVFHSLLAIIKERGRDNFEAGSQSIIPILEEVTKVCGTWLQQAPHLEKFSSNLFHFCRELVILTLNQGKFNVNDVYASNDSLLVRNHRSKSIGSIDTAMHSMESYGGFRFFSGPPLSSPAYPHSGFTKNYVLKGEPDGFSMSPTQKRTPSYSPVQSSSAQFSSSQKSAQFPPVQKTTEFSTGVTAQFSTGVTAIVPVNEFPKMDIPTILPPIHASLRSGGQVHYDMKTSE